MTKPPSARPLAAWPRRGVLRLAVGILAAPGLAFLCRPTSGRADDADAQTTRIVASRFAFTPEKIVVTLGRPVVLRLASSDVIMGIRIPELGLRADMLPGRETELRFTPTRVGTYSFHCDVFCGDDHDVMDGTIEVVARG